jgi:hypothetical protein
VKIMWTLCISYSRGLNSTTVYHEDDLLPRVEIRLTLEGLKEWELNFEPCKACSPSRRPRPLSKSVFPPVQKFKNNLDCCSFMTEF